jgi:hypothetical protein
LVESLSKYYFLSYLVQYVYSHLFSVNWASKRPEQQQRTPSPKIQNPSSLNGVPPTLHGAEIQFSFVSKQTTFLVTEATIRAIFQEFGEIQDICIKKTVFNDFGFQNGYGFIHYPLTTAGISAAIQASFIICQLHIDQVLYDCSFTHGFEKFLGSGGFDCFKQQSPYFPLATAPRATATTRAISPCSTVVSSPCSSLSSVVHSHSNNSLNGYFSH